MLALLLPELGARLCNFLTYTCTQTAAASYDDWIDEEAPPRLPTLLDQEVGSVFKQEVLSLSRSLSLSLSLALSLSPTTATHHPSLTHTRTHTNRTHHWLRTLTG